MRTLVVHTGGLGDFLLACPSIAALAAEGPVELLGRSERLELAVMGGIAAAAHDIETTGFDSLFHSPTPAFASFLSRFDRCVVWMRDDGTLARAIGGCGVNDVRLYPGLPPADWPRHASAYYAETLGVDDSGPFFLKVQPLARYDVIIHPGSGGRRKNWPLEHFVALADTLCQVGCDVTWCLGPAEEDGVWTGIGPVIRPASPSELAGHLAGAALYIGNDSGATHLAAAVGCWTAAIFGPTDPMVWAPLGSHICLVTGNPWPRVEDVITAIDEGCS